MSLADDLFAGDMVRRGPRCSVAQLLEDIDDTEREAVQAAFDDPRISTAHIGRTLRKHGHRITDNPIQRHRRGLCLCGGKQ